MLLFILKSEQIYSKWNHCIKSILNNSSKYDAWLRQFTAVNLFLGKIIKQNLLDQFLQNWNAQMHESSKGRNYGLFKADMNLEKYIINLNGSLFYSMIWFRTANHKLPIATGWWSLPTSCLCSRFIVLKIQFSFLVRYKLSQYLIIPIWRPMERWNSPSSVYRYTLFVDTFT